MNNIILKGKHVTLRPITEEDADITFQWRNSERANLLNKGSNTVENQKQWIKNKIKDPNNLDFIIEYKNDPVGTCALVDINRQNRFAEYGRLLIGEEEKTQGSPVFYETSFLILEYAFEFLHLHKIHGHMADVNTKITKFWLNTGWKQDGIMRDHQIIDGKFHDCNMSILENEYRDILKVKLENILKMYK